MVSREALARTFGWSSVRRSLAVALFIGTLLNAINQGPEIFGGHWPVWWKVILTYFVPFAVASYGELRRFPQLGLIVSKEKGATSPGRWHVAQF